MIENVGICINQVILFNKRFTSTTEKDGEKGK